ncbi:MAG: APH(6) family putative aminoglycoside O-phosphotransferase [Rudaea sp.]|nr:MULTISPECIES: aminoglycoside phosphotransferase family protein [unclassified Rudaea]MBN8884841.1 APH(6) family putative aminoglycoside O-phosphotransferase [Rudaea sp.]
MFDPYLSLWNLTPDGEPFTTPGARLLRVRRHDGAPAMLKIGTEAEEKLGHVLMRWWDGRGAARVLEQAHDALLLERATGTRSLAAWARGGRDDEATRILCDVLETLHAPRTKPLPAALLPLQEWFVQLGPTALAHGGMLTRAYATSQELLADPRDIVTLHGDIHHDNVLDFGPERGWLAIDPKRLLGERGFDYANIFCNPDLDNRNPPVGVLQNRFLARLGIVSTQARLERGRLLRWILAWCGLSAAWFIEDGDDWPIERRVMELAIAELDR